jgi:hypothetical protein
MEQEMRNALKQEIAARKLVMKRLRSPLEHAQALAEKVKAARIKRIEELSEYKSYYEAQEAYGFGAITEEEFDAIVDFLENNEQLKEQISVEEHAAAILAGFVNGLSREIAGLEFELLPPKKQQEIRDKNYELLERRRERENKC